MNTTIETSTAAGRRDPRWARLGLAGFCFFLAKGLLWLGLAAAATFGW
jgi:hypothetical protein